MQLVTPTVATPDQLADGRTLGRNEAPVTLVVWSDFQCPSCAAFSREVQPKLVQDFVLPGQLKIEYRDDAFIGPESVDAAVAARCAADQDRFWPYHDYLFWNQRGENSGAFDRTVLDAIGRTVGLDMEPFDACLDSPSGPSAVTADTTAADDAGVKVTPTLQIGATMMPGAPLTDAQYTVLKKVIERTLPGQ